jgi:hypothetical protein
MHRPKLKLLSLCMFILCLTAMFASVSQGATLSWLILNSSHTTATELKAEVAGHTDSTHLTLDGEAAGLKFAVTCTAFTLTNVNLEPGGKLTEGGKVTFTKCRVYKAAPLTEEYRCTVKSTGAAAGTVESGELKGSLELVFLGSLLTKIEPKAGSTGNLAVLRFEGAECVLPELNQVHGVLYLRDPFITTHSLEHLIESDASHTALYIGGHTAARLEFTKVLGSAWVGLAGFHFLLDWAAMDV